MYHPGFSSGPKGNHVFVQRVPLLIIWISNVYDFVDGLTWHRFCDSKLRMWLYKMEDKYSDRFYIEADNSDIKQFFEFMKWDYDSFVSYNDEEDIFPQKGEHCYYEDCQNWITGESDYCDDHDEYNLYEE